MSERPVSPIPAVPAARPLANGSAASGLPWDLFFAGLPPDAQTDLLARAACDQLTPAELPHPTGANLAARFLAADPSRLPDFAPAPLADLHRPPTVLRALSAALGCPDLFLADAGAVQNAFAADLAAEIGHIGERVLVLTPTPADADTVIARLGEVSRVLAGRALAPEESPTRLPPVSAARTARAHGEDALAEARSRVKDALRDAEARTAAIRGATGKLDELRGIVKRQVELDAEIERLRQERDAIPVHVADSLPVDATFAAELARIDADATKARDDRDAKQNDLDTLRHQNDAGKTSPKKSGVVAAVLGWFHRPDPTVKGVDLEAKLREAETGHQEAAALVERLTLERAKVEEAQGDERSRRIQVEIAARTPAIDAAIAKVTAERSTREDAFRTTCSALAATGLTPAAPTIEAVERLAVELPVVAEQADAALRVVRQWASDLAAPTPELVRGFLKQVRVVVGTPSTLADPLAVGEFDRVILTDADGYAEEEFPVVAAGRWILVGDAARGRGVPQYPAPRQSRNGHAKHGAPAPARPSAFRSLWRHLHRPTWLNDDSRLVALLISDALEPLTREPLADRTDVELRFTKPDGADPILAEVAFPPGLSIATAKAFLAQEVGEVRLAPCGPVHWHETADRITACWPAAESAGRDVEWIDLASGVREKVCGHGPDALTAAVSFEKSAGWDRESTGDWLARSVSAASRTASIPRPAAAPEPSRSRVAAGAAG